MKILFYGESPVVATGLAQVTRTIVDACQLEGHTVEIVGTNHNGVEYFDKTVFPYNIVPLIDKNDAYAVETTVQKIREHDYDVLFVSTDFGRDQFIYKVIEDNNINTFVIGYYAVDCDVLNAQTFNSLAYCNVKLTYTQHGKRVIEGYRPDFKGMVSAVPLACEPDVFYPLNSDERRKARKEIFRVEDDDTFIVINVNRNQARKNLAKTLQVFHEFHKECPNSLLYMHCQQNDVGGHIPTMARMIGMEPGKDVLFTDERFHVLQGFSREYLNRIYNAADCLLSTSLGEGWGLSTTEAMCARTPVLVPNNTAFTEIVGDNGYLIKSGGDIDHQLWLYGCTNHPHDVIHADDAIRQLKHINTHRIEAHIRACDGREWCVKHDKSAIMGIWQELFRKVEQSL